jgi:hypothetical protein
MVEEWAETNEDGVRVMTARRWTPHEISLVPTPADPGARIRMEEEMTETTNLILDREKVQTRAQLNAEIRSIARTAGLDQSWIDEQIDQGVDADMARRAAFEVLASRSTLGIRTEQVRVEMGESHEDPALRCRQACCPRFPPRLPPPPPPAPQTAPQLQPPRGRELTP